MLYYTQHAIDRMRERNISKEEVDYVIEHYDLSFPDQGNKNIMNYVATIPGYAATTPSSRRIRVVVEETTKRKTVITAMEPVR